GAPDPPPAWPATATRPRRAARRHRRTRARPGPRARPRPARPPPPRWRWPAGNASVRPPPRFVLPPVQSRPSIGKVPAARPPDGGFRRRPAHWVRGHGDMRPDPDPRLQDLP